MPIPRGLSSSASVCPDGSVSVDTAGCSINHGMERERQRKRETSSSLRALGG